MNRFLLAENPRTNSGDVCIIHTQDPIAIIRVHHDHRKSDRPFRQYTYNYNEPITFIIHHMFTTNMANSDDEIASATIDKLCRKAWYWYKSYLEWEDE